MDQDVERGGWIALAVGGGANLLFGLAYLLWSIFGLVVGGLAGLFTIGAMLDSGGSFVEVLPAILQALTPLISVVVFILVPIMAVVVLFSAFRYKSYQSKGLVWLGVVLNVLIPVVALLSSVSSCCGFNCCGFLLGNVGTVIVGVVALATTGYAAYTLTQDDVDAKFQANATE